MRKLTITLTDEQYAFAKSKGRLWLRQVVHDLKWLEEHPDAKPVKKPWWKVWEW